LEKIEMKKTLVAVAALAAATGAMAQVTISGFIDQAYNTTRSTTAAGASSTITSVGNNAIGQDALGFAVSEDLGNGLTAFGAINLIMNVTTPSGAITTDNGSGVGVKGAFGTAGFAQGYSLVWKTSNASDASGWGSGVGMVHGVGAGVNGGNAVYYSLPEIFPGLGLTVEKAAGETTSRQGDYMGMNATYTTGGFMASYSTGQYKAKGTAVIAAVAQTSSAAAVPAVAGEWTDIPAIGGNAATTEAVTAGSKSSISALALTYDFGMAKVFAGYNSNQSGGDTDQTQNSSTFGVTVPFGAVSVGIAQSAASYRSADATSSSLTGTRVLAKYAFSKRTNGYIQYGTAKVSGGASATGNGIGLTHSF
jgi:predicted porin